MGHRQRLHHKASLLEGERGDGHCHLLDRTQVFALHLFRRSSESGFFLFILDGRLIIVFFVILGGVGDVLVILTVFAIVRGVGDVLVIPTVFAIVRGVGDVFVILAVFAIVRGIGDIFAFIGAKLI